MGPSSADSGADSFQTNSRGGNHGNNALSPEPDRRTGSHTPLLWSFHAHRTSGRNRNHRDFGVAAAAGAEQSPGERAKERVHTIESTIIANRIKSAKIISNLS